MKSNIIGFVLAVLSLGLFAGSALAQTGGMTQTTDHYKITLDIGSLATMLTPDQVAGAKEGEAMVQMAGMPMPEMTMTDEGQPVNHHLEVHVVDKSSGAIDKDTAPAISITNQATGTTKQVSAVVAMYDVMVGESDYHWGNNVYLADGMYTVAIKVGNDTATFKDVAISGGTGPTMAMPAIGVTPSPPATGPMTTTTGVPTTMPMTGGPSPSSFTWLIALGGLASMVVGLVLLLRLAPRRI